MLKKVYSASAGTGKTHTIVSEAFEFIKEDFEKLKKIVFITFSNAGAEEIRERIYEKLKDKLKDPSRVFFLSDKIRVYTVHSFCRELCRIFRYELNFSYDMRFPVSEDVTIWDETVEEFFETRWGYSKLGALFEEKEKDIFDAFYYLSDKNAIKGFVKKYGFALFFLIRFGLVKAEHEKEDLKINLEDLVIAKEKIKYALQSDEKEEISAQAENMSNIISALSDAKFVVYKIIKEVGNIYINSIYEKSRLDFDALLFFAVKIMSEKKIEGVLKRLEEEGEDFEYLFVDEAQDCDMAMNYFLSFFMGEGEKTPKLSLVMVGDAKQSVYRWRNAYPEEFSKICREAEESSKLETMKISYRIKNKRTLDFLNSVMDKMKSEVYKDFFDYGKDDILDLEKSNKEDREIDVLYALMEDKNKILSLKDIEDFAKNKRVGILFRSRNNFKKSNLEKNLGEKIIYRMSEPIETESLFDSRSQFDEDEIADIFPDYSLLKNLFNLFGYDNSDKTSALLIMLLTEKGSEAALKISPDISKAENAKDFMEKAKCFCETVSELNSKYEGNYISEKLERFLDEKKLWKVFFRKESYLEPEQTVRYLNRVTANFYLKEKTHEFRSKDFISEILKTSKTPYETAVTYDNESKLNDFIEATTVHSAKGLTYDKVVFIANFNEMFDTEADIFKNKEEFSYLFSVSFDRVTMPEQKISVEFFPYLGLDTAKFLEKLPDDKNISDYVSSLFNNAALRTVSENACLFYVGVTRIKEEIMFLDLSPVSYENPIPILSNILAKIGLSLKNSINLKFCGFEENHKKEFVNRIIKKEIFDLKREIKSLSVRDYIKTENGFSASKEFSGEENFFNIIIGSKIHELISDYVKSKIKNGKFSEYLKAVSFFGELDEKAKEILLKNMDVLEKLLEKKSLKYSEVPIWGRVGDCLLRGVADLVEFEGGTLNLYEIKTVFSTSELQKKFGEKQLEIYSKLFENIYPKEKIKSDPSKVIEISAYEKNK